MGDVQRKRNQTLRHMLIRVRVQNDVIWISDREEVILGFDAAIVGIHAHESCDVRLLGVISVPQVTEHARFRVNLDMPLIDLTEL